MFKLWSENLLPDEHVSPRAYSESLRHPERSAHENWRVAVADEVVDRVKPHLRPLGSLDTAIATLYRQACLDGVKWDSFYSEVWPFLEKHHNDPAKMTDLFHNLTGAWTAHARAGRFSDGSAFWRAVIIGVTTWETGRSRFAHKGAGYFYWALNELLSGNLQHGFLLVHQALAEDLRVYGAVPPPSTPAVALATLDSSHSDIPDWARYWIKARTVRFAQAQSEARKRVTDGRQPRPVALPPVPADHVQMRKRLITAIAPERMYMLAYAIAQLDMVTEGRSLAGHIDFASQLILDSVAELGGVLERAIEHLPTAPIPFPDGLGYRVSWLSKVHSGQLHVDQHRKSLRSAYTTDPSGTIESLLDRACWTGGPALTPLDADIAVTWMLRNHGTHDPTPTPVVWRRADDVVAAVLRTMAMAC